MHASSALALPPTVAWTGSAVDGHVSMIDQTLLPHELRVIELRTVAAVAEAIVNLRVRGAPAIGVTAAFGMVVATRQAADAALVGQAWLADVTRSRFQLAATRPTAVNLFYALDRMWSIIEANIPDRSSAIPSTLDAVLDAAQQIAREDLACCQAIGEAGAKLIPTGGTVLTHCNAGALATAGIGTATAPMYVAHQLGKTFSVLCDETRPVLQGARLTVWELRRAGVDATLLCDNMAAAAMRQGRVQMVVVGADRIAANGDTANKIGTYGLAVLARHHAIPFYVAAPTTTIDRQMADGSLIPIEQRSPTEVTTAHGHAIAAADTPVWNPAFDVTPAELITAIITERGLATPVNPDTIAHLFSAR